VIYPVFSFSSFIGIIVQIHTIDTGNNQKFLNCNFIDNFDCSVTAIYL